METNLDPQLLAWLGPTAVSVLTVLSGIYAVSKWIVPRVRKFGHVVDDLFGEPERPGVAARPGLMTRLGELEIRTKELMPNSGSSMKDTLNRIEFKLENLDERVVKVEKATCVDAVSSGSR